MAKQPKLPPIPSPRQTKAIRAWLGLKQQAFAAKASISLSTLMDYERGNRNTSEETRIAIALYVHTLPHVSFAKGGLVLPE